MVANSLRVLPLLALLAGSVACSGGTDAAPAGTGSQSPAGHSYESTTVQGPGIPGDGPLRLTFGADGNLSANAGCNTVMGQADLTDHTLRTGALASTRMACVGDRAGADEWNTSFLQAAPAWTLDGETLTLKTADRTVTLRETEPDR